MASIESAYGDYNDLVSQLADGASKESVYEEIMAKEQNRIDLINRVVSQKQDATVQSNIFYNRNLIDIAIEFSNVWKSIFTEIFIQKTPIQKWQSIMYDGDRKIYMGIMCILIGFFLYFVDASS